MCLLLSRAPDGRGHFHSSTLSLKTVARSMWSSSAEHPPPPQLEEVLVLIQRDWHLLQYHHTKVPSLRSVLRMERPVNRRTRGSSTSLHLRYVELTTPQSWKTRKVGIKFQSHSAIAYIATTTRCRRPETSCQGRDAHFLQVGLWIWGHHARRGYNQVCICAGQAPDCQDHNMRHPAYQRCRSRASVDRVFSHSCQKSKHISLYQCNQKPSCTNRSFWKSSASRRRWRWS